MTFNFRPAVRESVSLLLGIAGGTGAGKTFSGFLLAKGMTPPGKRFAVIDTEAGRARHYADRFAFDHGDLAPPFTPDRYAEAIKAADDARYPVIVVDSASHEHAGDGGLLDMHEAELDRMAGNDWQKRANVKMAAWIKPKMAHKAMVNRLLQVRAHLILCFRAEEKVEMVRGDDGKMKIVPKKSRTGKDGWIPICEKSLPYELTCSFLMTDERPGYPLPIKLQEQHKHLFPLDRPITEESGRALAAWAAGGSAPTPAPEFKRSPDEPRSKAENDQTVMSTSDLAALITEAELAAKGGLRDYEAFFRKCNPAERRALQKDHERLKESARKSDEAVGA